jgi:hypothetical protein
MSYTTENLLVEYQRTDIEDAPWQAWTFLGSEKSAGNWESCLPGEYVNRKGENLRLRFRLVKRTAVITDEVLAENPVRTGECAICGASGVEVKVRQEHNWLEKGVPDYQCTDQEACDDRYDEHTREYGDLW